MSFFKGLFKSNTQAPVAAAGVNIQSSVFGKPIPIVYGTTRVSGNLNLYGNFVATPGSNSASSGKGGTLTSSVGKGGSGSTSYTYSAAFAFVLCEGPIRGIGTVWQDKTAVTLASLGFSLFTGTYPQSAWGTTVSWSVTDANNIVTTGTSTPLGYNGFAYVADPSYQLGSSTAIPNTTYEVQGVFSNSVAGQVDADPSLVVVDLLTNVHYGAGFPSAQIGSLSAFQAYCLAAGLLISPAYTTSTPAAQMIDEICVMTNSAAVWSSGLLTIVPYGDTSLTGNGKTYTPLTPVYNLTDNDFMASPQGNTGASSSTSPDPVLLVRKRQSDKLNSIKLEYLDRSNAYNPAVIYANDQASIDGYGLRTNGSAQAHMFCSAAAASLSANLQLRRQVYVCNTYQFDLDQRYSLLDPMDIVTITDTGLGLFQQWVRITEIVENDDGTLSFSAEEVLNGTGNAPAYSFQQGAGYSVNFNTPPGNVNPPIIFEPPDSLGGGLFIWGALSGGLGWGGCEVWQSTDGLTYEFAYKVTGSSRMGVLSSSLAAVSPFTTPPTIDTTNTLAIDLTESGGSLLSASQAQALALNSLCYVDGELLAYQTATLTAINKYSLTYLVRGAYGTTVASHAAGSKFARLDSGIFSLPFTQDRIGQTIYLKFLSFNQYGGGKQSLSQVNPYSYTIAGTALASTLPNVQNFRSSYVSNTTTLAWDEVIDFRPVIYEIRKGATWSGALSLGRTPHPWFSTFGDGTYWVSAYTQPTSGLIVYSNTPSELIISGSVITQNVLESWDEAATGWLGTFSGTAGIEGSVGLPGESIRTGGGGNILTDPDFLNTADVFNYGGEGNGIYTIPVAHQIDVGYVGSNQVMITWSATGSPNNQNILTVPDVLGMPDFLGAASTAFINVYPEIALSQDGSTWGAWVKFAPGVYTARKYNARMQLQTNDPGTTAICPSFTFGINVPGRIDHYTNLALLAGGSSLTFHPDGASAAAFNGGPSGAATPHLQITILNAQSGDQAVVSSLTLSSCTLQVTNGGLGVARSVNVLVQGF